MLTSCMRSVSHVVMPDTIKPNSCMLPGGQRKKHMYARGIHEVCWLIFPPNRPGRAVVFFGM
jgi:hypothetical protein